MTSVRAWLLLLTAHGSLLTAQTPSELARERADFAAWLQTAPLSPFAVIAMHPVGRGISIGSEPSDIPLPVATRGIAREEGGLVVLDRGTQRVVLPRGRAVPLERFQLVASGGRGRAVIAAFGAVRRYRAPSWFPFTDGLILTAALEPPERHGAFRTLGLDGVETEAVEVGFAAATLGHRRVRLRVYRVGQADDEEAPLLVFFRDSTNGRGTYPAGRFVELIPQDGGMYRLDFNRARNPFCAYSTVFPCPAPWPGNVVPAMIRAGERYRADS
jgi:uncharacterized protein (DUF1684 family)